MHKEKLTSRLTVHIVPEEKVCSWTTA